MTTLIIALHHNQAATDALRAACIDHDVEVIGHVENGLSSAYHAYATRLRQRGRILPALGRALGASRPFDAYDTKLIVSWSAPYALVQDILESIADRDALNGIVMLDSGYGPITPGIVDFARLARDRRKLYSAFYTDVATPTYDSSGTFLQHVQLAAGAPAGLFSIEHLEHDEAAYRGKLAGLTGAARAEAAKRYWENEHIGALHQGPRALAAAFTALGFAGDLAAPSPRPAIPPPPPTARTGDDPSAREIVLEPAIALDLGMMGAPVFELQRQLNQLGAKLHVDGIFGPLTEVALMAFQRAHNVGADGRTDKSTRIALAYALASLDDREASPTEPPSDNRPTDIDAAPSPTPFRLRCLARAIAELGVHETPGPATTPRVQKYLDGCVRKGRSLGLVGDSPAWCAAFQGWAQNHEALPGDAPIPWRAAVSEVWADAVLAGTARHQEWSPRPGDLAVFGRIVNGKLQDPRAGGAGHLAAVELVPDAAGRFGIVGGNQGGAAEHGGAVTREVRWTQAKELVGWIEVG